MTSSWTNRAACKGMDPDLFFPQQGGPVKEALAVCATCPVIEPCKVAGAKELFGIWGGMTVEQRRKVRWGHGRAPGATYGACQTCGKPVPRARAMFCSRACRYVEKVRTATCAGCGIEFTPKKNSRVYHSRECYQAHGQTVFTTDRLQGMPSR